MRLTKVFLFPAVAFLSLTACSKFLDVKPKGIVIPESVNDYKLMLNSKNMNFSYPLVMLEITDDFYDTYDDLNTSPSANAYFWRAGIDENELTRPVAWGFV